MASRGRDLTFSILSDSNRFDLDKPAQDLETLGDRAENAGDSFYRMATDVKRLDLEGTLGRDAKRTADKVDDAFDAIARASRTSARKVDDDAGTIRNKLGDVRDEAGDTAREAAASFSSTGDIGDAFQELAANAGQTFGPIGIALGAAAGVGIGLFRAKAEELKEEVDEIVDAMIEGAGRVSEEFVDAKLVDLSKSGDLERIRELVNLYDIAGINYRDMARARAGDEEAIGRVVEALDAETSRRKTNEAELTRSEAAVAALASQIDGSREAYQLAREAMNNYTAATGSSADKVQEYADTAGGAWDDLRSSMYDPITGKVRVQKPSRGELRAVRASMQRGLGTLVVPVRPGQTRFQNTASNSRYRY